MEKILNNEGGLDEIYNPKMKCTPKTKQIFKLQKMPNPRSTSCYSDSFKADGDQVMMDNNFDA